MSGLRIAMLAPFGIRPKGTLAARMLPLARALVRRGYEASIVAPPVQNPQDAGSRAIYDGVPVTHISLPRSRGPAAVVEQAWALARLALRERPHVIHLFKPKGYSGLAALALRAIAPGIPLVVDTDDWEGRGGWNDLLPYPRAAKALFAWQERDLPRRAAAVTVASRTLQTQVWGFGVSPEKVFYLPNGASATSISEREAGHLPPMFPRSDPEAPLLLLYTRFWEFDVRDIVAALVGVVAGCPSARLRLIGRGERGEERELLRLAARAGVASAIDDCGWVEPAALPALLASADLALVPMDDTLINRARGLAKLLELMSLGLPIVASHVGQAAEYIEHGQSGLLVAPGDPGALARAALHLLSDADLRRRLGVAARTRAQQEYAWEHLARQAERAYACALGS